MTTPVRASGEPEQFVMAIAALADKFSRWGRSTTNENMSLIDAWSFVATELKQALKAHAAAAVPSPPAQATCDVPVYCAHCEHEIARCPECGKQEWRIGFAEGPVEEEVAPDKWVPLVSALPSSPVADWRQLVVVNRDVVIRRAQARLCPHEQAKPCYACLADEAAEWMRRADERASSPVVDNRLAAEDSRKLNEAVKALQESGQSVLADAVMRLETKVRQVSAPSTSAAAPKE